MLDYIKAMFGIHAMHVPCQVILQEQGKTSDGRYSTSAVCIFITDEPMLSEQARAERCPHELIIGDLVIRPHGKFASRDYVGHGLGGLTTSMAMFPEGHTFQTLDNGFAAHHPDKPGAYGTRPKAG